MAKIGLLALGVPGHWNPTSCLARALQVRRHSVTAFSTAYYEDVVRRSGLDCCTVGATVYPRSRVEENLARIGTLQGRDLLRFTISAFTERSSMFLDEAPNLIRRFGLDLLLVDQFEPAGASIAERLRIPFITLCNALVADEEPAIRRFSQLGHTPRASVPGFVTVWFPGLRRD
jgi:zeaxanthin glucosyltransferase